MCTERDTHTHTERKIHSNTHTQTEATHRYRETQALGERHTYRT